MNSWEKFVLTFLMAEAEAVTPIFVKSSNGVAVINASEPLVNALIGAINSPTSAPSVPAPTPATASATGPVVVANPASGSTTQTA